MNIVKRIFAVLLFLLALFTAAVAYHLIVHAQEAKLKVDDAAPTARLEAFFDALEAPDYPAAYACATTAAWAWRTRRTTPSPRCCGRRSRTTGPLRSCPAMR